MTADDPFADEADEEVDAVVSESTEENFLFAWKFDVQLQAFFKFNLTKAVFGAGGTD